MINNSNLSDFQLEHISDAICSGSVILKAEKLTGGVSADITKITIRKDNKYRDYVVRVYGDKDIQANPSVAMDEYNLMKLLTKHEVKAPESFFYDDSFEIIAKPYIVVEFIEGQTIFQTKNSEKLIKCASEQLVNIHKIPISKNSESLMFSKMLDSILAENKSQDFTELENKIYLVISKNKERIISLNKQIQVLLHGDFWPGNILWKNESTISAVIDWEDSFIGNPLYDLASARLEFKWAFGDESDEIFLRSYIKTHNIDVFDLPLFDLLIALKKKDYSEWFSDTHELTIKKERYKEFVAKALNRLESIRYIA